MERVTEAIRKAREQRGAQAPAPRQGKDGAQRPAATAPERAPDLWDEIEMRRIAPKTLKQARVVTHDKHDAAHTPLDMLRTRIVRTFKERGWNSLCVTSPTPNCGKTVTSLNLGFSLARQLGSRTALIEFDLIRPQIAGLLKQKPTSSIADYVNGEADLTDVFFKHQDELAIALADKPVRNSAELLQSTYCGDALRTIQTDMKPDVVIYDMPPLFAADDALGFAPRADCVLIVAAAGQTSLDDLDRCVTQLSEVTEVLGVVLNKCEVSIRGYGYYGYYNYSGGRPPS